MQRAEQVAPETWWLRWIGPWQYQVSASQINQYTSVPYAKIIGGRLTFSPFQSLELGASRIMQWGGEGVLSRLVVFGMALRGTIILVLKMNRVTNWQVLILDLSLNRSLVSQSVFMVS
jgi:hypothetical protein